jgi:hypothetical protein
MEEPGEQDIVVFALFVTEPVSECVYVEGMEGGAGIANSPTFTHISWFRSWSPPRYLKCTVI